MAQVSAQKCALCDKNIGSFYCYECQHALCTDCRKKHGKIPAISGHTVADINTVNLSIVNKTNSCDKHGKEIHFYCTECSNLICSNCVTSTHKSHTISDISDVVEEERIKAKENLKQIKLKTEAISSLQEKIRREHIQKLHVESKKCIGHIESVCKDLQSFLEAKGNIKTTEVEDNENIENQNFEAFLKNTDLIHKQYVHILSELENLLLEKHDITFYLGYRSIQCDIETLVSIPDEPPFARVPRFEDESLYREIVEQMESKMDKSLCQNCSIQKKQIEDLQAEYNKYKATFYSDIDKKNDELQKLSQEIQSLKEEVLQLKNNADRESPSPPITVISRNNADRESPSPPITVISRESAGRVPPPYLPGKNAHRELRTVGLCHSRKSPDRFPPLHIYRYDKIKDKENDT